MEHNGHTLTPDTGLLRVMWAWTRSRLAGSLGSMKEGKREVDQILGYKQTLLYQDFLNRYLRQDIAGRIIDAYPDETWGMPPQLVEDISDRAETTVTPFETAWQALNDRLRCFACLEQADRLARLGHYSVVLLGLAGQADLSTPARPVRGPDDLLYLQFYSEECASIERFEADAASPLFRKPVLYRLTPDTSAPEAPSGGLPRQVLVHASRLLHIPGELLIDDEIYGRPCLEAVYNDLDDLLMVRGGAAYGWWQDAKRRFILALREGYTMTAADAEALTKEAEEFDLLKNFLRVQGMDVTPVRGEAANPANHFSMLLDLLAAATGIPKRILMGSERGELSSAQDERAWLGRISRRQVKYAEPRLVRALVDRCIALRVVPQPQERYLVQWENLLTLTEPQQATVARDVATAVRTLVGAHGDYREILSARQFVEEYLGIDFTGEEPEDLALLVPTDEGQGATEDETLGTPRTDEAARAQESNASQREESVIVEGGTSERARVDTC